MRRCTVMAAFVAAMASPAMAQFGTPGSTPVREKIVGNLVSAEGAPTPGANDQVGVFFANNLVGAYTFPDTSTSFTLTIFGDNPATEAVEGPKAGERVEFRYFDASANATRTDLRVENLTGEAFNYRYAGENNPIPDGLPIPIDLTPTRNLNIRIGATNNSGGGGAGGDREKYDVDGNGKIDSADAAMVLRLVIGGGRGLSDAVIEAADVNDDSVVNTRDAIEILRQR